MVSSATIVMRKEFRLFASRNETSRGWNIKTGEHYKVGEEGYGSRNSSWLQMQAEDVTAEDVAADIVGESIARFKKSIPLLWNFLRTITHNEEHEYRRVKFDEDGKYIPADLDDKEHITSMIIHMMFNKYSRSLRRFQVQLGLALYGAGSKERIITTLAQYGISIGIIAIDSIFEQLAEMQMGRLLN